MKKYIRLASFFVVGLSLLAACKKETPAPTATISETITENVVEFTVVATDASKFEWNFGDNSVVSTIQNPTHTYTEYGKNYTVSLKVTGPGGEITVTKTITIAPMSKMTMITGGVTATNGKKWRISSAAEVSLAFPDATLTIDETYPAGILTMIGMGQVYTDEYIFFNNNDYEISPQGGGVLAGFIYCAINSIPNEATTDGADAGLTYATPFTPPTGLTFTLNENKDLTVTTTSDGINPVDVTYNDVTTLSFSTGGFVGLMDFMSECIVQELTSTTMKIAFFASVVPAGAPQEGKATNVLILTFEVAP
jgi:PKD repeat protein